MAKLNGVYLQLENSPQNGRTYQESTPGRPFLNNLRHRLSLKTDYSCLPHPHLFNNLNYGPCIPVSSLSSHISV